MSSKNNLYIVYHFLNSENFVSENGYKIILMYSEVGEVQQKDHPEIFKEENLIYKTKEDLLEMGKKALNLKTYGAIYLLSSSDFNVGIETCHDLSSFREIYKRYGQLIAGSDDEGESNIFGKFF